MKLTLHMFCLLLLMPLLVRNCMAIPANEIETIEKQHLTHQNNAFERQQQEQQQQPQKSYDIIVEKEEEEEEQVEDENVLADDHQHSRYKRQLNDLFIAPNTRWCGRGNTANGTYNTLGGASLADKCCRRHDHCQIYIPSMSNKYEFFNYRPYTLSYCNCDRRFHTCLKMANDEDATTIGKLFFNIVQTQCFKLKKFKTCLKRDADGRCESEHVKMKAYLVDNKKF